MISPLGVLIPAEWCAEIGQHAGRSLRIDLHASPKLLELVDQLAAVGAAVSDASGNGSRRLNPLPELPHTPGMTVTAYAKAVGLSDRRVRQMCAAGDVTAHKVHGQWAIYEKEEES